MNSGRRNTRQLHFKCPELTELRKLGSLVDSSPDLKDRYRRILTVLNTDAEDEVLNTLVQFYDSVYKCFTFPDYQLAPSLEEYSYYIYFPLSYQIPFSGLEEIPKSRVIGESVLLRKGDIDVNLVTKGVILGLPTKILMEKVATLVISRSMIAFEVVLTLLIYGIILFPNVDNFVDISVIRIFLIQNLVPTLLVDTYYSIHHIIEKNRGAAMCSAPLLYKWFSSHLPHSSLFKDNKECLRWSQRIMSLINTYVTWYYRVYDNVNIIDICGKFYNHKIHRKGKVGLGNKDCVALGTYTRWVQARAPKIKMPYPPEEPMFPKVIGSITAPVEDLKGLQVSLAQMNQERDAREIKFHVSNAEMLELQK
ncbi:uncharacterized protein LOC127138211 [Lathyrus oleraceus]|uniref:uncharacterized protein LOC127138211 n=1 Tax=Pisum sativum TaxID=3888 RepID=UPI0021D3770B|nr:uncharacterized protein LOC127138211 [Pisum sativum]